MSNRRTGGLVWPILLIAIGGGLLLNNLGMLEQSIWALAFRLWPAILLAIGIDILIPRQSVWGTLVAIVAVIGVFVGSYLLLAGTPAAPSPNALAVSQPVGEAQSASVRLDQAIGRMIVDGGAGAATLIEGSADPVGSDQPEITSSTSGSEASVVLDARAEGVRVILPTAQVIWDLSLTDSIPLDIQADIGAGEIWLDLRQVQADDVEVSLGVGQATVILPDAGDLRVSVGGGVGELVLRVPAGADVTITADRGLAALSLPDGYTRDNDTARSGGAASGAQQIEAQVDLGVGLIRVETW